MEPLDQPFFVLVAEVAHVYAVALGALEGLDHLLMLLVGLLELPLEVCQLHVLELQPLVLESLVLLARVLLGEQLLLGLLQALLQLLDLCILSSQLLLGLLQTRGLVGIPLEGGHGLLDGAHLVLSLLDHGFVALLLLGPALALRLCLALALPEGRLELSHALALLLELVLEALDFSLIPLACSLELPGELATLGVDLAEVAPLPLALLREGPL